MQKTALNQERWRRVEEIYHAALDRRPDSRAAFLTAACHDDAALRREVETLLAADNSEAVVDRPALEFAGELFEDDAPLAAGTQLGPYRIEKLLGSGGMGRVYRARDTRLNRTVAVKISKEEFSERFEREARAVAALNHPNICQLYDVGPNFLVMELVEGSPLRGPLPLPKAVEYAGQILDALEAAHRKGLVHRDLKPANILAAKPGIKLLDFGLAKQTAPVESNATVTQGLTGAGAILGTIQYMSPEQLQGKPVDARSDLFSFGCVLYEMLTGKRAFEGENPASVIAAVLEREPAPLEISPPLDRVVERCLAKDPDRRFQTAVDLKAALNWAIEQTPAAQPAKRPWMAVTTALALFVVALGVALWVPWRKPLAEPASYAFTIDPVEGDGYFPAFSLSPDGRQIAAYAFDARGQSFLLVRHLNTLVWRRVPVPDIRPGRPSWSPNGRELAFVSGTKIRKMDIATGAIQNLSDAGLGGPPLTGWSRDGMIVFSRRTGLWRIPASGGEATQLTRLDENRQESFHHVSQFLPDGRHFLYLIGSRKRANSGVFVGAIDAPPSGNRQFVLSSNTAAVYAPGPQGSGYLLFEREGALMGQVFDTASFRLTGEPILVLPEIGLAGTMPAISISGDGVMAYRAEAGAQKAQLAWFTRKGERLGDVGLPGRYPSFALSPDGSRVALHRVERDDSNIWMLDLSRGGAVTRLTLDSAMGPVWSPDGRQIAYVNRRAGSIAYRKAVDGTGVEEALPGPIWTLTDWSADGRSILGDLNSRLTVLADGKATSISQKDDIAQTQARFSPDGKWIAYTSDESKRQSEVYVQSFPPAGAKYQISTAGGTQPRWRRDGRELFYIAADGKIMAVPVKTGATFEFGSPVALFQPPVREAPSSPGYAVSSDGQRFLMRTLVAGDKPAPIFILTNWLAAVKK